MMGFVGILGGKYIAEQIKKEPLTPVEFLLSSSFGAMTIVGIYKMVR